MKNYFKIGLMALTLAFGVTSCDKDDNGGSVVNALSLEAQGLASKVTFNENAGLASPKGYNNLTAKGHSEFTHRYAGVQVLSILNADEDEAYRGTYVPNEISGINPSDIILANGSYVATSSNASYTLAEQEKVVIDYLPYTSEVIFDLSAAASIQLVASLQRGFLIVNAEDAIGGHRVTGATADGVALFGPDAEGDFYGYLLAGPHDIVATYTLNGESTEVGGPQIIGLGSAYTLDLLLMADTAVVSETVTITPESSTEAALALLNPDRNDGGDINDDEDNLDTIVRNSISTQATLNGENNGDPVVTSGRWSVVIDTDISVSSTTSTSTETEFGTSVNNDGDLFDLIEREVIITTTTVDGTAGTPETTLGEWTISENRSVLGVSEDNTPDNAPGDPADTLSEWSAWSPLTAAADVATIDQVRTRTVITVNGISDTGLVLEETRTIDNDDYVAPVIPNAADEFSYSAFVGEGTAPASRVVSGTAGSVDEVVSDDVEFFTRTITTPRENVVDAYSYVQTRTVSIVINDAQDDPALNLDDAEALTQTIEVAESRTDAADHVATEEVLNPNYNQPVDATNPSGIVNITGLSVLGQSLTTITVVAPDGGSASVDGLVITFEGAGQYTVSFTGNALVGDFDVTFTVSGDATGSTFTLPASSESDVAFGN